MSPEARGSGFDWRRALPLAFVALALVYLWPLALHPNGVAFPPGSQFTDLLISHLPNVLYWRDALTRYGQWPLWNDQIYAGLPFAADPLASLWYPPEWLLLVLPLPLGFNVLLGLHLAWAGYGLFRFLRGAGLGLAASLLGGAAFAGTPKLIAHLGAGHVTLVYAVAWTPWLLLAVRGAVPGGGRALARGALAGAALAITFLADVRWAFYAGLLAVAYGLGRAVADKGRGAGGQGRREAAVQPGWREWARVVLGFGVFFLLLSAVLALPLIELARATSRSALTLADGGTYSLPPIYLLGLVIPDLGGFHEWMTYLGVVTLLLALAGLSRRTWWWGLLALLAAAYSLGTNFILFPLVFRLLPLASLLRVPPRAWFLVTLAAAILAGYGLQRLLDKALPWLAQRYSTTGVRLPSRTTIAGVLFVLMVLDLVRMDSTLLEVRPVPAPPLATAWLQQQPGLFRVYSPSYSLPYGDGLQHVDGVDPLQLSNALAVIGPATGVLTTSYSVTVPPFAGDDLATANAGVPPSASGLAQLDVKYVAAEFAVAAPGFQLLKTFGSTRVYLNQAWVGRAWVEGQSPNSAQVTAWSPNRVQVQAAGPGVLVLSEINYPGWRARIDGQPAPIETADGALRAVMLSGGEHAVEFDFEPASLYVGGALSLLGLLALPWLLWAQRRA